MGNMYNYILWIIPMPGDKTATAAWNKFICTINIILVSRILNLITANRMENARYLPCYPGAPG